jgi:hypothetical protein
MGDKNSAHIMVPILVFNPSNPKIRDYGKGGDINIYAAVNAAYALMSPMQYNNQKDAQVHLRRRMYLSEKKGGNAFKEIIRLDLIIIELSNIK